MLFIFNYFKKTVNRLQTYISNKYINSKIIYNNTKSHFDTVSNQLHIVSKYFYWIPTFKEYFNYFLHRFLGIIFCLKLWIEIRDIYIISLDNFIILSKFVLIFLAISCFFELIDFFYFVFNRNLFLINFSHSFFILYFIVCFKLLKNLLIIPLSVLCLDNLDLLIGNYLIPIDSDVKYINKLKKIIFPNLYPTLSFWERLFLNHYYFQNSGPMSLESALSFEKNLKK